MGVGSRAISCLSFYFLLDQSRDLFNNIVFIKKENKIEAHDAIGKMPLMYYIRYFHCFYTLLTSVSNSASNVLKYARYDMKLSGMCDVCISLSLSQPGSDVNVFLITRLICSFNTNAQTDNKWLFSSENADV